MYNFVDKLYRCLRQKITDLKKHLGILLDSRSNSEIEHCTPYHINKERRAQVGLHCKPFWCLVRGPVVQVAFLCKILATLYMFNDIQDCLTSAILWTVTYCLWTKLVLFFFNAKALNGSFSGKITIGSVSGAEQPLNACECKAFYSACFAVIKPQGLRC